MTRKLKLFIVRQNNIINITELVAKAIGTRVDNYGNITISGIGYNAGEHVVYMMSLALFNDGYKLSQKWI